MENSLMSKTRGSRRALLAMLVAALMVAGCMPVDHGGGRETRSSTVRTDEPSRDTTAAARSSVVKVRGVAPKCGAQRDRTGFVVAPHRVMTVAHGVAGAESVSVELGGTEHKAQVMSFDPSANVAILDVAELDATPLTFAESPAANGADARLLVDRDGSVAAAPVQIRETIELEGPDIYRSAIARREVYTFSGTVKSGDAGSPLIGLDGRVLGMAFGASIDDDDFGFALTAKEIASHIETAARDRPVGTGRCVS